MEWKECRRYHCVSSDTRRLTFSEQILFDWTLHLEPLPADSLVGWVEHWCIPCGGLPLPTLPLLFFNYSAVVHFSVHCSITLPYCSFIVDRLLMICLRCRLFCSAFVIWAGDYRYGFFVVDLLNLFCCSTIRLLLIRCELPLGVLFIDHSVIYWPVCSVGICYSVPIPFVVIGGTLMHCSCCSDYHYCSPPFVPIYRYSFIPLRCCSDSMLLLLEPSITLFGVVVVHYGTFPCSVLVVLLCNLPAGYWFVHSGDSLFCSTLLFPFILQVHWWSDGISVPILTFVPCYGGNSRWWWQVFFPFIVHAGILHPRLPLFTFCNLRWFDAILPLQYYDCITVLCNLLFCWWPRLRCSITYVTVTVDLLWRYCYIVIPSW